MALNALHHVTVQTDDLEATRDFYRDILGLTVGFRPNLDFPGYWLYCGDIPVVHLVPRMNAIVEPLPLVPATWSTGGRRCSGWSSAARMRHMRSSARSIRLGCSAKSRETMESIWLMQGACARRAFSASAASGFPSENAALQKA